MANGKQGDHPITDIETYGASSFGEPIDGLVKNMRESSNYLEFRGEIATILWENFPWPGEPALIEERKQRALSELMSVEATMKR